MPAYSASVSNEHPDYKKKKDDWQKVRDCLEGEKTIKEAGTKYLPQPEGMSGIYSDAYDSYKERAHFPLICTYALQGALGVLLSKLPEFKLPKQLNYLQEKATKDGKSLNALFLDTIIEVFTTGRAPLLIDILPKSNKFCFVQYKAEDFVNWKVNIYNEGQQKIDMAVMKEIRQDPRITDPFDHTYVDTYRVLSLKNGIFTSTIYNQHVENDVISQVPKMTGRTINEIPLVNAGSVGTSFDMQIIPLISVANCSIQIYRKEADLANSEFLSCNPTLIFSGADDDETPNVVGSSVAIYLQDSQARAYYTKTDTQALTHVKDHVKDLYDEAIRHGIALLEARKGVEAAEALRIRQSTQVATIYSIYRSTLTAIIDGLKMMCRWAGLDETAVSYDAPKSLTQEVADQALMKELIEGAFRKILPLETLYKYISATGLIDPTMSFDEYKVALYESMKVIEDISPQPQVVEGGAQNQVNNQSKNKSKGKSRR